MDETYRQLAAEELRKAQRSVGRKANYYFREALRWYAKIANKTESDHREMSATNKDLAINYFNDRNHAKAAKYYLASINHLLQLALTDYEYRKLTGLYIDLSDAYLHSYNQQNAVEAISNAIKAFGFIAQKRDDELALGDPNTNFPAFHHYFEQKSSNPSYVASTTFCNHESLLHHDLEEKNILAMFEKISIEESLDKMMESLTLSKPAFLPFFSPAESPDQQKREMARGFLQLTKEHIQAEKISTAIETYQQANKALRAIEQQTQSDRESIDYISQQIEFLYAKRHDSKAEKPSITRDRMFAPPISTLTPQVSPINSEEESEDNMAMEF